MQRTRLGFNGMCDAQIRGNRVRQAAQRETGVEHSQAVDVLQVAILSGSRERRSLEQSVARIGLSKVVEALRRFNLRDDFNGAVDELVEKLSSLADLVVKVDGIEVRGGAIISDVEIFLAELRDLEDKWSRFDQANLDVVTLNQEIDDLLVKIKTCDEQLRLTAVQEMIVNI